MIHLEITSEEYELLQQVLKDQLTKLEIEINHTDHGDFKASLKHRREVLTKLIERVGQASLAVG